VGSGRVGRSEPLPCLPSAHGGVLGAQLLAQLVVMAERLHSGRRVLDLHVLFVRPGRFDRTLTARVAELSAGRSFASTRVTFEQEGAVVAHADVLLSSDEPEGASGWTAMATSPPPEGCEPVRRGLLPWDARWVPVGQDGASECWFRIEEASEDEAVWRALLAFTVEPLTVVHAIDMAGWAPIVDRLTAAVVSQTITFARPVDVRKWHRVRVEVPHLGGARVLGRGTVSDDAGVLGATYGVSALLRGGASAGGERPLTQPTSRRPH